MTARTLATAGLWLAIGFSPTLKSDTNPVANLPFSHADEMKTETPQNAPEPKSPTCQDSCLAEGWDAEDCRAQCTWFANASPGRKFSICSTT